MNELIYNCLVDASAVVLDQQLRPKDEGTLLQLLGGCKLPASLRPAEAEELTEECSHLQLLGVQASSGSSTR